MSPATDTHSLRKQHHGCCSRLDRRVLMQRVKLAREHMDGRSGATQWTLTRAAARCCLPSGRPPLPSSPPDESSGLVPPPAAPVEFALRRKSSP